MSAPPSSSSFAPPSPPVFASPTKRRARTSMSPPASTPRKKTRSQTRGSALPTPSPHKNSPFPLARTVAPGSATPRKRVVFAAPSVESLSPSTPPPSSAGPSKSSLIYPPVSPGPSPHKTLPPALQSLLLLHRSLSVTLSLHLATHPPVLPPPTVAQRKRDPNGLLEEEVVLEKVANYEGISGIRETVENGAGRNFALEDLKRLAWLYEWHGEALPTSAFSLGPALLSSSSRTADKASPSSSLMNLTITPTRTLARISRAETQTYCFNLALTLSAITGGVTGAVGRWSSRAEERDLEFRRRLDRWVELCQIQESEVGDEGDVPLWKVRLTPMKRLEPLPGSMMATAAGLAPKSPSSLRPAPAQISIRKDSTTMSSPARILFPPAFASASASSLTSSSATSSPPTTPVGTVKEALSVSARRQALRDRIAAKSAAASSTNFLSNPTETRSDAQVFLEDSARVGRAGKALLLDRDELKRRSILSRLSGVAEAVFMLFTTPPSSSLVPPSPSSQKRRALPLEDVASVVVKSSKTEISHAEAIQSLQMLAELCPTFIRLLPLAGEDYVEMPAPTVVSAASLGLAAGISAVGGPASPGKVRKVGGGGLREVRERIRRELGE